MPALFDGSALALRRARAARLRAVAPKAAPDFLLRRVAEDFSDRLRFIKRSFHEAIDLSYCDGVVGPMLVADHGVASVTFADFAPRDGALVAPVAGVADLIVSGLALQTVDDLPTLLARLRGALRPDGLLLAALAGGRTLGELREAFLIAETECGGGASPRVAPAIDVRDLGTLLQRAGFALPVVDSDVVVVTYADPLALMRDLRAMGATNVLAERRRTTLRRDVLGRAIEVYQERHSEPDGRIRATFEILTATAWAPHESQQKPLRPGSATTRLADALGQKQP